MLAGLFLLMVGVSLGSWITHVEHNLKCTGTKVDIIVGGMALLGFIVTVWV